ncbi:MAG: AAA family ATPase [Peptoniphilaceae bacterium]|nr:AAA family ATPase [Peptoniphilaceae bacterium]MDD7383008.1 AAA family ATPase [Peptoniphilaceae bacterium]MDY3737759.1 AAA family ATPase [Peptoniphilaceae bacterium]
MSKVFIKKLILDSFGKFENYKLNLEKISFIYGKNESGKSTIADFIEGIFYGFCESNKRKFFNTKKNKYKPFSGGYYGSLILEKDDIIYKIKREFDSGEYEIYDITNSKKINTIKSNLNYPGEYFLEISYDLYKAIVIQRQSEEISISSKEKLKDSLISLKSSGDFNFSGEKAIEFLKQIDKSFGTLKAKTKPLYILNNKKNNLEKKLEEINYNKKIYNNEFKELYNTREELKEKEKLLSKYIADEKNYHIKKKQQSIAKINTIEEKIKSIDLKIEKFKNLKNIDSYFFEKMDNLYKDEKTSYDSYLKERKKDEENIKYKYIIFIFLLFFFLILFFIFKKIYLLIVFVQIIAILMIVLNIKNKNNKNKEIILQIRKNIQNGLIKIGAKNKSEYEEIKKEYSNLKKLTKEKEYLKENINIIKNSLDISENDKINLHEKISDNINIDEIQEKIDMLNLEMPNLRNKNLILEKKMASLEEKLDKESNLTEEYQDVCKKLDKLLEEKNNINLAIDTIEDIRIEMSQENANFINKDVTEIIRQITKGKYKNIQYDDLNPSIVNSNNDFIEIDKLSTGLTDQINFALRFTLARKVSRKSFFIFDDSFVNYDDERLKNSIFYLLDQSNFNQIIYFTSQFRDKKIMETEGIKLNFKNLED